MCAESGALYDTVENTGNVSVFYYVTDILRSSIYHGQ